MSYNINEALFNNSVVNQDGEKKKVGGEGRYVGLYFSAHWCPPCRGFTPLLAKFFKNNAEKLKLDIVFVSSDQSDGEFVEYFGEMPWYAVDYSNEIRRKLGPDYGVTGIPSLIILDGNTGSIVCKNARSNVMDDETGEDFPWNE
ncbi:hypothetical protein SNEBB_010782 [Seison nebaliae]|nr:hypothetical protein SNEBB_010782 [Seison nebaliae]